MIIILPSCKIDYNSTEREREESISHFRKMNKIEICKLCKALD